MGAFRAGSTPAAPNMTGCGVRRTEASKTPSSFIPRHIFAPVAQWIEHLTSNQGVIGSSPIGGA